MHIRRIHDLWRLHIEVHLFSKLVRSFRGLFWRISGFLFILVAVFLFIAVLFLVTVFFLVLVFTTVPFGVFLVLSVNIFFDFFVVVFFFLVIGFFLRGRLTLRADGWNRDVIIRIMGLWFVWPLLELILLLRPVASFLLGEKSLVNVIRVRNNSQRFSINDGWLSLLLCFTNILFSHSRNTIVECLLRRYFLKQSMLSILLQFVERSFFSFPFFRFVCLHHGLHIVVNCVHWCFPGKQVMTLRSHIKFIVQRSF